MRRVNSVPNSELIGNLEESAKRLGLSLSEVLGDKIAELEQRFRILCIANPAIRDRERTRYLARVLDCDLTEITSEMFDWTYLDRRHLRLDSEQRIALERIQNYRCRLCGTALVASAQPHVDHVISLAMGGSDDYSNFQLLCSRCNQGKSVFVDWRLAVSFQRQVGLTARARYCVLSRDQSRCSIEGCNASSWDTNLEVLTRIPTAAGGRNVFDNMMTLCKRHVNQRLDAMRTRYKFQVGRIRKEENLIDLAN
jgi:5-methylcytosine-specific restriction endonuclease McrA